MIIHVDRVPMREEGMTPYEVMLSESQERMLLVVEKGREPEVEEIFERWDLHAVQIGEVTADDRVRVYWHGDLVADVPAEHLVLGGGAPVYIRETRRPPYLDEVASLDLNTVPDVTAEGATAALESLLASHNIASKRWVFEQYDTTVRTNTVVGPGPSDAAVVRLKGTSRALAVKTDCNGRYVYLNPRRGGQIAVAEAARNVACSGGRPLAITNCLNFGNPYKPEVYWVFKEAVGGMGDACRRLNTPVTGGNVSFYNESPDGAVFPTPTVGMLGLIDDVESHTTTVDFKSEGDAIYLVSPASWHVRNEIGGSEYLAWIHARTAGDAPHLDLDEEAAVHEAVLAMIRSGAVRSAHDVSDGGLAVCLAESAIHSGGLGADVTLDVPGGFRLDAALFGEAQSRVVVTVAESDETQLAEIAAGRAVGLHRLGVVSGSAVVVRAGATVVIDAAVDMLKSIYESAIADKMHA
jgi:phosphoribosylformylglycinamidine synthase